MLNSPPLLSANETSLAEAIEKSSSKKNYWQVNHLKQRDKSTPFSKVIDKSTPFSKVIDRLGGKQDFYPVRTNEAYKTKWRNSI